MKSENIQHIGDKSYIKSKVGMLPTEDESLIGIHTYQKSHNGLSYDRYGTDLPDRIRQHLYFLSDEEIKQGDYVRHSNKDIGKVTMIYDGKYNMRVLNSGAISGGLTLVNGKKIIASTDKSLVTTIRNRKGLSDDYSSVEHLPRPSNEFLKAFCDRGGIDEVLIEVKKPWSERSLGDDNNGVNAEYINHNYYMGDIPELKVAQDNTITIKPVQEDIQTQALEILKKELSKYHAGAGTLWDNLSLGSGYSQAARDIVAEILALKPLQEEKIEDKWISVKEGFPNEDEVVDIWAHHNDSDQKKYKSLEGSDYFKKYCNQNDLDGWRIPNMKFFTDKEDNETIHLFRELKEEFYKILCVENGEILYWRRIISPLK